MSPEREIQLVTDSAEGDDQAFADLVRFLSPALVRFLVALIGNVEAAEEIAQTAFLRAHQHMHELRDPARFKAWLWRIAKFAAFDLVRKEKRRGPEPDSLESMGCENTALDKRAPEHGLVRFDLVEETKKALDRLPLEAAEVLRLRYEEELTYQQIADRLGMTLFQVKAKLARARAQLKPRLLGIAAEWKRFSDETS